ncbi:CHASE domain-containing protein, partial [Methylibium sp.]|uniref:CHASE domain-containing hybrid sensor histidine kinase/response regulator n=1 Tax=Methylibium sp. TaxID=2067992 RepID=UPI0017BB13AA
MHLRSAVPGLLRESFLAAALAAVISALVLRLAAPSGASTPALALLHLLLFSLLAVPAVLWRCSVARSRADPERPGQVSASWRLPLALSVCVLLGGFALTSTGAWWLHQDIRQAARARFERQVETLQAEIERRINQPIYGLKGARGVFAASRSVERAEFRAYVESRDLPVEFPGVRAFAFAQRVLRKDLERFIALERADSEPHFDVHPRGDATELHVIKFIEPLPANRAALGFDLGSEAVRREAIDRAARTGEPTLTGRIALVQDGQQRPGFIYMLPLFRQGSDPVTQAQRKAALLGLLCAPIIVAEVLDGSFELNERRLDFELFDGSDNGDGKLLYAAEETGHGERAAGAAAGPHEAGRLFATSVAMVIGDRALTLRVRSNREFEDSFDHSTPILVGLGGALLSAVLALSVWLLAAGRERALALAGRMTADLDRLAKVAERTSNLVVITDAERRITWVNEGFTRVSGYSLAEALGRSPGELLQFEGTDPATVAALRQALDAQQSVRCEILNRSKSGQDYWLDIDIQPLRDAQGRLSGFMAVQTDITASKAAAGERAREKQRLADILEGTNVGTWEWNVQTGEYRCDERWAEMIGFSLAELAPLSSQSWLDRAHPDDLKRSGQLLERHFSRELDYFECESRMRHRDGRWIWVLDRGRVSSWTADGRPEWMAGTQMDITDRKQAEERLNASEAFLERAGRIAGVGSWELDLATQRLSWSAQTRRICEVAADYEPTLEQALDFYAPESRPLIERAVRSAMEDAARPWDLELDFITATGRAIRVRAVGEAEFAGGRPIRLVGTFQDVTARHAMEEEIRRSNTVMRSVLDAASEVAVIATGTDLKITVFNRGAERLLGYAAGEVVGLHTPALFSDPEEVISRSVELSAQLGRPVRGPALVLDAALLGQEREWRYVRKDASRVSVSMVVTAMRTDRGELLGYLGVAHDVTRRNEYEESLRHAMRQAEQASVAKSRFLANMSHEIRTPMNAILGMLALLQKTPLTARQLDYAGKTEGAARSLLGLLNDILDFSKVEAGKMALDPQPFRIDHLLRDLSVILSATVGDKDVEVLFDIDPSVPRSLLGDALRLQQVLINLAGNAVKFTSQGEVVIGLRVAERSEADVLLDICVRDTGIGIAPEHQARIFEGFSQAEASTTRRFGGSGLGLSISQRLVELMGGTLSVQSTPGLGSSFGFRLRVPVADSADAAGAADAANAAGAALRSPLRALIVDDNATARELLAGMAQSLGWQADMADSGEQALHLLQARAAAGAAYEAVFVDWQMPGMDGWECSMRIRALAGGASPTPLLVMVTAHGREMLAQRSPQEQALLSGFLVKPVTASMLFDAVTDAKAARDGPPAPHERQASRGTDRLAGLRILVVEDNANNRQVAQELLSDEGAIVSLANDGRQGVDAVLAAAPPFDAVLMDLQMPVMDGYAATASIRLHPRLAAVPIIAMTANAMASDREACLAAGMNDHIGKPFDLGHLVATLRRHTRRSA